MRVKNGISIIIPVRNALPHFRKCVASIRKNTSVPHELIIVDNASGSETLKFIRSLKGAKKIFHGKNLGFSSAVNAGIRASSGEYIFLINSDIMVYSGWAEPFLKAFSGNNAFGALGPITNRTVGMQRVCVKPGIEGDPEKMRFFANAVSLKFRGEYFKVHRLVGFFMALRREAVDLVGLFDPRFTTGCFEDFDYSLRLRQAGYELGVLKDVFVYHHHHGSFSGEKHFMKCAVRNRKVFIDKWCAKALEFLDEIDPYIPARVRI